MEQILKAIPHRPPFLFVDKVIELTDTKIRAIKEISPEEPFFKGHYPGNPIMPGVLICESIFQTAAILLSSIVGGASDSIPVLTRISNAKFKKMVKPGSVLEMETELVERVSNAFFLKGKASVSGNTVVTVEFACSLAKPES
jgi:3-hydroxyacyl-[acyl-carrier-protein] dehydratase